MLSRNLLCKPDLFAFPGVLNLIQLTFVSSQLIWHNLKDALNLSDLTKTVVLPLESVVEIFPREVESGIRSS